MLSELQFWILDSIKESTDFEGICTSITADKRFQGADQQTIIQEIRTFFERGFISCEKKGQIVRTLDDKTIRSAHTWFLMTEKGRQENTRLEYEAYYEKEEKECICKKDPFKAPLEERAVDFFRFSEDFSTKQMFVLYECDFCGTFWEAPCEEESIPKNPQFIRKSAKYVKHYYQTLCCIPDDVETGGSLHTLPDGRKIFKKNLVDSVMNRVRGRSILVYEYPYEEAHVDYFFELAERLKSHPELIKALISTRDWRSSIVGVTLAIILRDQQYSKTLVERLNLEKWPVTVPQVGVALALINDPSVIGELENILSSPQGKKEPTQTLSAYYALEHMNYDKAKKATARFRESGALERVTEKDRDNTHKIFSENYKYWSKNTQSVPSSHSN